MDTYYVTHGIRLCKNALTGVIFSFIASPSMSLIHPVTFVLSSSFFNQSRFALSSPCFQSHFLSVCWVSHFAVKHHSRHDKEMLDRQETKIEQLGGRLPQRGGDSEKRKRETPIFITLLHSALPNPPLSLPLYGRAKCRSVLAYSHQQQSVLPQLLTHLTD